MCVAASTAARRGGAGIGAPRGAAGGDTSIGSITNQIEINGTNLDADTVANRVRTEDVDGIERWITGRG
jgi:hypothetical protein